MKTTTAALANHLNQEVTTLATCVSIVRQDGETFRFTDHDADLVIGGFTFKADSSYIRTAVSTGSQMAVDNLDVTGMIDTDDIDADDIRNGLFDHAQVEIFVVNWQDPNSGRIDLRMGWFGEIQLSQDGVFQAELRGLTQMLNTQVGKVYTPLCRTDLGSAQCGVVLLPDIRQDEQSYAEGDVVAAVLDVSQAPFYGQYGDVRFRCTVAGTTDTAPPTFNTTIGGITTDGTVEWTTEPALTQGREIVNVINQSTFEVSGLTQADDWFERGLLVFEDGPNQGRAMEIRSWDLAQQRITTYLPISFPVQAGDHIRISPGCDKRRQTCRDKFSNIINFRGEPFIPGLDSVFSVASPRA